MIDIASESIEKLVQQTGLQHIAIIMDGNRRWAKAKGLPSAAGHKKGVDSLKTAVQSASEFGVKYLSVYAFSTENWNRKQDEVSFLMRLLGETIKNELDDLNKYNVQIRIIGDLNKLEQSLQDILNFAMDRTADNTGLVLQIAINYGAQDEILNAVRDISAKVQIGELSADSITKELFEQNLYTAGIPDPDLLIRTGGEQRISNFLLWQIAYSEVLISEKFWPEFDKQELSNAITEFANRTRRFGAD